MASNGDIMMNQKQEPLGHIFTEDDYIVGDNEVYSVGLWDESLEDIDRTKAYLYGDYYYVYRGTLDTIVLKGETAPGIYWDGKNNKFILVDPVTPEEKAKYTFEDKIGSLNPKQIVDKINNHEVELVVVSDVATGFAPPLSPTDDILKRLIKRALIEKGINLDNYKGRFTDKNALFNFKQVVKGPNKLSIMLFDRGTEALNLKYTVILEEVDPLQPIGLPLAEPLVASSDEVYEV